MKNLLVILLMTTMFSCSKSPIEQSLEKYVVERADGVDMKYKLKDYHFIDTITVQKMMDSLSIKLTLITQEPNLEEFKNKRDQEFKQFRDNVPDYEEKVMRGELKDASDWCTEIRIITEKADSIIANWNKVDRFSYDFNYLSWWYTKRSAEFYEFDYKLTSDIDKAFRMVQESKNDFEQYEKIKNSPKDSVIDYVISHTYSIYNPLIKSKIEQTDYVYFDYDMRYKQYKNTSTLDDILKQLIK
ncbi:hypothetical protein AAA214_23295 [Parabacteroides goldsteinii]|uniref:hypothetical protein n=1 Tax=Parabacteroides goldsteinii TaxID=328812 RepID=UPI0032C089CB